MSNAYACKTNKTQKGVSPVGESRVGSVEIYANLLFA